jgi:predicted RNase H-like HicB family nuclease
MERPEIALTAVFLRGREGYVGFIEELPNVNCHAHSLEEARSSLRSMVAVVFEEERRNSEELTGDRALVRESFKLAL